MIELLRRITTPHPYNQMNKNDAISVDTIMLKSDQEGINKNDLLWTMLKPKIEKLNNYSS